MKNVMLLFALLVLSFAGNGQAFEGTVTVEITYDLPPEQQSMASMLPQSQTFQMKDNNARMDQEVMGNKTMMIRNNADKVTTILMEVQGMKYKVSVDDGAIDHSKTVVEHLDETKEILGYKCKKAKVVIEGGEMVVHYTTDLPAPKMAGMEEIDGFPLEYEMSVQGMKMHYLAVEVKEESIDSSIFIIPEGFQEMTQEMKAMMGMGN